MLTFDKRKLEQSGKKNIDGIKGNNARKRTNNKWFETQDSISYWDDFNKPKIMFSEIVRSPQFYLDTEKHFVPEATAFILCSEDYNLLKTLIDWLNSPVLGNIFKVFYAGGGLGDTGYRYKKKFLQNLPIPKTNNRITSDSDIYSVYGFNEEEINFISSVVKPKVD